MGEVTPRFGLPLIEAGQAQKELFHNEAITLLETLAQPVVQDVGENTPPAAPLEGQSWLVGGAPGGDWTGHADAFATWTAGGWRFVAPPEGMCAWVVGLGLWARWSGDAWITGAVPAAAIVIGGRQVIGAQRPAIAAPNGGTVVDAGARSAVSAILDALRTHGLIAT